MSNDELAGATWRKSSRSSGNGACVEVANLSAARVAIRDSKDPDGPALVVRAGAWAAFATAVKTSHQDLA